MPEYNFRFDWNKISTLGKVRILVEQVVGSPSQAQISQAVADYIDSHPGALSPLSQATKSALLQIAEKVAYIDANGQSYYNALNAALNARALLSITAVYTQTGTVYDTDSLDSLKADLVVTAYYDDGTTADVTSASVLSGTLAEGTSTVTVTYQEKTATFTVTVSTEPYVTNGLIAYWDAIDNTGTAHDSSATSWVDKVNGYVFQFQNSNGHAWNADSLQLSSGHRGLKTPSRYWETYTNCTIEYVLTPDTSRNQIGGMFDPNSTASTMPSGTDARQLVLHTDGTVGFKATSSTTWSLPSGVSDMTGIKKVVGVYTDYAVDRAYVNNVALSLSDKTHSYGQFGPNVFRLGEWTNTSSNNSAPFYGKIYAVRVYNRALTADEITKNFNYDNARFNLGL